MSTDTIGSGQDHTTHADWWAAIPSELSEMENGRSIGSFVITSTLQLIFKVSTATEYPDLRPQDGESFVDQKDAEGFKLSFDASNGVNITCTTNYQTMEVDHEYFQMHKYQLKFTTGGYSNFILELDNSNIIIQDCILENDGYNGYDIGRFTGAAADTSVFVNCLMIDTSDGNGFACGGESSLFNCTFIKIGAGNGSGCAAPDGNDNVVIACAFFGWDTAMNDIAYYSASTDYNASDEDDGDFVVGANSQDNLTWADQFIDIGDDFRVKDGSDLIAAGNTNADYPNDILGNVRGVGTAGTCGCHEYAIAFTLDQKSFRMYEDGTESGSAALEAVDTDITIDKETPFQLRIGAQASGNPDTSTAELQYRRGAQAWRSVKDA